MALAQFNLEFTKLSLRRRNANWKSSGSDPVLLGVVAAVRGPELCSAQNSPVQRIGQALQKPLGAPAKAESRISERHIHFGVPLLYFSRTGRFFSQVVSLALSKHLFELEDAAFPDRLAITRNGNCKFLSKLLAYRSRSGARASKSIGAPRRERPAFGETALGT